MASDNRPLSPHLQVYRWQITMALSILHRMTGVGLGLGLLLLTWWVVAAATGPDYFDFVQGIMASWLGRLILLGFTWALFFHLCNGIRHLFWDAEIRMDAEIGSYQDDFDDRDAGGVLARRLRVRDSIDAEERHGRGRGLGDPHRAGLSSRLRGEVEP